MARVMTMRLPARDDRREGDTGAAGSATLAAHFLKDVLRASLDQELRHAFPEGARLLRRSSRALLDVLQTVDRAHAGVENQFVALDARPGAERNLAAPLKNG